MTKKISYYELTNIPVSELKKQYKMSDRQVEHAVRSQMWGASKSDRENLYKEIYKKDK